MVQLDGFCSKKEGVWMRKFIRLKCHSRRSKLALGNKGQSRAWLMSKQSFGSDDLKLLQPFDSVSEKYQVKEKCLSLMGLLKLFLPRATRASLDETHQDHHPEK